MEEGLSSRCNLASIKGRGREAGARKKARGTLDVSGSAFNGKVFDDHERVDGELLVLVSHEEFPMRRGLQLALMSRFFL